MEIAMIVSKSGKENMLFRLIKKNIPSHIFSKQVDGSPFTVVWELFRL